jgi:transcriptional regulator with XRE-family HTH domain
MATLYNDSVAAAIRDKLSEAGRSQSDLAAALGWSEPYLSRRLTGNVSFSLSDIERIATALDVPRSQLLGAPLPFARGAQKAG